jgi:hypothetical protein
MLVRNNATCYEIEPAAPVALQLRPPTLHHPTVQCNDADTQWYIKTVCKQPILQHAWMRFCMVFHVMVLCCPGIICSGEHTFDIIFLLHQEVLHSSGSVPKHSLI